MKRKVFPLIMIASAVATTQVKADDLTHFAAHFGASYAINTAVYGFCHKAIRMDRTDSLIFAATISLLAGAAYKYMEAVEDKQLPSNFGQAMGRNALGVAGSIGTVVMFNF